MLTLKNSRGNFIIGFIVFLIAAGIIGYFGYTYVKGLSPTPPPYEITNFSGKPKIFSKEMGKWVDVERGMKFRAEDKLQTEDGSQVDLKIPGKVAIRVKENSVIEGKGPKLFEKDLIYKLYLERGDVLAATDQGFQHDEEKLQISTKMMVTAVRGTKYHVHADPERNEYWVSVLRGQIEVFTPTEFFWETPENEVQVNSLYFASTLPNGTGFSEPKRVSQDQWKVMKEAYDLIPRSAAFEAAQLDLSKEAGGIYEYVFDHGTFYTPKMGFASRTFIKDENTNDVILEMEYDVFSLGSFVGIYNKIREFDMSDYKSMSFWVRRAPGENHPDFVKIEVKAKGVVQRGFPLKNIEKEWTEKTFLFNEDDSIFVSELVYVYTHDQVGQDKKGVIQLKDFKLTPLTKEEKEARDEKRKAKAELKEIQSNPTLSAEERQKKIQERKKRVQQQLEEKQQATKAKKVSLSDLPEFEL